MFNCAIHMRLQLLLCTILVTAQSLLAQTSGTGFSNRMGENVDRGPSLAKVEEKGYKALEEGDDYLAMDYFSRVIAVDSTRVSALRGYALACMNYSAYPLAAKTWERLLQTDTANTEAAVKLAETQFRAGNYPQAQEQYLKLLEKNTLDTIYTREKVEERLERVNWALKMSEKSDFATEAILLDSSINTDFSEYMNWPRGDGSFFFSSYRFPFKKLDWGDLQRKRRLVKIIEASPSADTFLTKTIDFGIQKQHVLHPTFNSSEQTMYYALGKFINTVGIQSQLYWRNRKGEDWGPAQKLGASVNVPGYTSTEPNLVKLNGQDAELLFFVSDRPGGKGGRDIWYVYLYPDGTTSPATNLEAINTPEEDVTPFYHAETGTLYFSSNGRVNLGGFDVFKTVGTPQMGWTEPVHLSPPVNSSANDVFFTLTPDGSTAYLSSNRFGAANLSEEACCYDIFQVPVVKPKMIIVAFHATTRDSLPNTNMKLYELVDGKRVLVDSVQNIPVAYYPFAVSPGKTYLVVAEKPGFKPDSIQFVTPRTVWPGVRTQHVFLDEIKIDLVAKVFDRKSKEPILGSAARFIDLGPSKPTGKTVDGLASTSDNTNGNDYHYNLKVDRLYKVLISKNGFTTDSVLLSTDGIKEDSTLTANLYLERGINLEALVFDNTSRNPIELSGVEFKLYDIARDRAPILVASEIRPLDNRFNFTLEYGHRYLVVASKENYSSDSIVFNVPSLTSKPFEFIHQRLEIHSLELEQYLPIRLYFDNDEPNKRSYAVTTTKLYSDTYFTYYTRKDTFINVFTEKLRGNEKKLAEMELEIFFEDSLRGEWNRLRFFTEILFEKLKRGDHVEISIRGFASPRASAVYNKNLTARRIVSVINHFKNFDGALLSKYVSTGQLVVKEVPNGESQVRPGVNDKVNDPRNSVFSLSATKERRVEIVEIEFNEDID